MYLLHMYSLNTLIEQSVEAQHMPGCATIQPLVSQVVMCIIDDTIIVH